MNLSPRLQTALAALLYLGYAVFLTWPVVGDLDGRLYGNGIGDLGGAIAHTRAVVDEGIFPFAPSTIEGLNHPFGLDEAWVLNWATLPGTAMLYGLAFIFGSVAAHTLFVFLGFVLSGVAMFLLARRVTGSPLAAVVAGFAFAFYPFAVGKAVGHLHFMHGWVLVLPLWRFLALIEEPTARNGLLAGAAGAFAMWFTPYFMLIAGVEVATLGLVALGLGLARGAFGAHLKAVASAAVPIVALLAALAALTVVAGGGEAGGLRTQSIEQLTTYAARLHEFVVPDANNLLFGDRTRPYLEARLHGSNLSESSLYVGWSVLILALLGVGAAALALRRRRRAAFAESTVASAIAAASVTFAAFAFSAPPKMTILGQLVPAPAWFVFQITSTWRVYSRFITLLMVGLCLLAALGLAAALVRRRPAVQAAIVAALAVIVPLDLWARPKDAVTNISPPAVYAALREQPPGALVEYPIHPAAFPNYTTMFWQQAHDRPLYQGYAAGTADESRKLELTDPVDRETAPELAAFGIRYAIVQRGAYDPPPDLSAKGFRKVYSDAEFDLWRVTARPARTTVDAIDDQFALLEGATDEHFRWLAADEGDILVTGRCDPCSGTLTFQSSSYARPRRLQVVGAGGRVLHEQEIGLTDERVSLPLSFRGGEVELKLRVSPAPDRIQIAADSTETAGRAILMREPRFRLAPGS